MIDNFTGLETSEVVLVSAAHCNFVCKVILNILIVDYKGNSFFLSGPGRKHRGDLLLP